MSLKRPRETTDIQARYSKLPRVAVQNTYQPEYWHDKPYGEVYQTWMDLKEELAKNKQHFIKYKYKPHPYKTEILAVLSERQQQLERAEASVYRALQNRPEFQDTGEITAEADTRGYPVTWVESEEDTTMDEVPEEAPIPSRVARADNAGDIIPQMPAGIFFLIFSKLSVNNSSRGKKKYGSCTSVRSTILYATRQNYTATQGGSYGNKR